MRPSRRHLCHLIVLALGISISACCFGAETRTLAQVCAEYGVSQSTNTMLHGTERLAKRGGTFFFPR